MYTGNTVFGVQNLEYDPYTKKYFLCVYPGQKPEFPNPPMFAADARIAPEKKILCGVWPGTEGEVLALDSRGIGGIPFPHGDTGFAALGDGRYYVAFHGGNGDGQFTEVRLFALDGDRFVPGD